LSECGVYELVLYKVARQEGVIVELQELGGSDSTAVESTIAVCTMSVDTLLRKVPKYVVGDTKSMCPINSFGRE
jgi:hypothetical protein